MSTDVATTADGGSTAPAPLSPPSLDGDGMARLAQWVTAASQAHQLVAPLVHSAFVPDAYKPQVGANASDEERAYAIQVATANATSAVLLGLSLGFDPLTALQQIYIVHGRPGMYSKAKVALLQSRGYQIRTLEATAERATVQVRRPGATEPDEPVTITMEDAKRAEWDKNPSKAYQKTPADMLWARAASRACDRSGASVLLGIATVEDIEPEPSRVEATVGRSAPAARMTAAEILAEPTVAEKMASQAQDAVAAGSAHAPRMVEDAIDAGADPALFAAPPTEPDQPVQVDPSAPIREEQRQILSDLLSAAGLRKTGAMRVIKEVTGRTVAEATELLAGEAAAVIAKLKADAANRAEPDGEPR